MRFSRWAFGLAGILMIVMAALNAAGYGQIARLLSSSGIPAAWLGGIKGLWLIYSIHLIIVGTLFLMAAARPEWVGRPILAVAGFVPVADTILLLTFVGVFVGSVVLGLSALLVIGGAAARPSTATRSADVS
jgi:hypothetical protein